MYIYITGILPYNVTGHGVVPARSLYGVVHFLGLCFPTYDTLTRGYSLGLGRLGTSVFRLSTTVPDPVPSPSPPTIRHLHHRHVVKLPSFTVTYQVQFYHLKDNTSRMDYFCISFLGPFPRPRNPRAAPWGHCRWDVCGSCVGRLGLECQHLRRGAGSWDTSRRTPE